MMKSVRIDEKWKIELESEFQKSYFSDLVDFIRHEYQSFKVFPPASQIFSAFNNCPFDQVKVIILGQDPYHSPNLAHGLSFSVPRTVPFPPSLRNIYKELCDDLGVSMPVSGDLTSWTTQGVLLLNSTLTVRAHNAGSHQNRGWERFTDSVIDILSKKKDHLVFVLWGAYAQKKAVLINPEKHLILCAPHPSPLSAYRGFWGSKPFSQTNSFLTANGLTPIDWGCIDVG